jgi:5,10-methylenetetrahydromethanopterin reductase
MGLSPLKLAELEHAVAELRALFRGESVTEEHSGQEFRLSYLTEPVRVPIYIAASAPKILKLAGRIADGVIVLVGTAPEFISSALATVESGARESGRTLADLHIVLWTPTAIQEDSTAAKDLVRAHVSRVVIRPLPAPVDPALDPVIDRIRQGYDYYQHMDPSAHHAGMVPDELVDLFALAGTPEECQARLKQIADLGVDQVSIVPFARPGEGRSNTIRTFAEIAGR